MTYAEYKREADRLVDEGEEMDCWMLENKLFLAKWHMERLVKLHWKMYHNGEHPFDKVITNKSK